MKPGRASVDLDLHAKQSKALLSDATELGYGGAAGGGKSHLGRVAAIFFCYVIPGLNVYLFRRQHNELVKNHMTGPTSLPAMLHPWTSTGFVRIVKDEIRFANGPDKKDPFANGSRIFLCHCQHEKDVFNWLGPEMHFLIIEQAEQFTPFMIQMLRGRNRIPDALNIPAEYKHLFPRVLYTFNPGGVGHAFFKSKFVKALKRGPDGVSEIVPQPDIEGGKLRQFIQAKLDDNPSVDPVEYRKTLRGLPPRMAKALEEGDFDQVVGAFFPEIDRQMHLVKSMDIPSYLTRVMGMDWGACGEGDPFAIGWWCVADGNLSGELANGDKIVFPRGALICYRRWYGKGLPKVTASNVAREILLRERGERISSRVAGGDIDDKRGHGISIYEIFAGEGVHFAKADKRRQPGHLQFRERLIGRNGKPMIYWFEEYEDELETIMNLQHDLNDVNDCTDFDDHVYECFRGDTLVKTREGIKAIKDLVGTEGFVKNHKDEWVPYWNCKSYGVKEMLKLSFSDGAEVVCTSDHRLMNFKGEWVESIDMLYQRRYALMSWKLLLSQIKFKNLTAFVTTSSVNITQGLIGIIQSGFIGLYGNIITGRFLKDFIFTIKTITEKITTFLTLSVLQPQHIYQTTCANLTELLKEESTLSLLDQKLQSGISQKKEERAQERIITNTISKMFFKSHEMLNVSSAEKNISLLGQTQSFANQHAKQNIDENKNSITLKSLVKNAGKSLYLQGIQKLLTVVKHAVENRVQKLAPVCLKIEKLPKAESFCLTTVAPHAFKLANGVVVANCDRYVCMHRPWTTDEPAKKEDTWIRKPSIDELWAQHDKLMGVGRNSRR